MIDDLVKSFKATLYDRAASPLSGAFILSWCLWNWKIIVLLVLGNEPTFSRISQIEGLKYLSTWWESVLYLVVFPLLSALVFLYGYPYPARKVYTFSKTKSEELIKLKDEIEKKTPVSQEKYDKLILQMNEKEHETAGQIESKNATISALERDNKELKDKIYELSHKVVGFEKDADIEANENKPLPIDSLFGGLSDSGNKYVEPVTKSEDAITEEHTSWRKEYSELKKRGKLNDFGVFINNLYQGIKLEPSQVAKYESFELIVIDVDNQKATLSPKGKFFSKLHHSGKDPTYALDFSKI
jgi:hypothetical protein